MPSARDIISSLKKKKDNPLTALDLYIDVDMKTDEIVRWILTCLENAPTESEKKMCIVKGLKRLTEELSG